MKSHRSDWSKSRLARNVLWLKIAVLLLPVPILLGACDGAFVRVDHYYSESALSIDEDLRVELKAIAERYGLTEISYPERMEAPHQRTGKKIVAWFDYDPNPSPKRGGFTYLAIRQDLETAVLEIEIRSFPDSSSNETLEQMRIEVVRAMENSRWTTLRKQW